MFSSCCHSVTRASYWRCRSQRTHKLKSRERAATPRRGGQKGGVLFDILLLACIGLAFVASEPVTTYLELVFGSVIAAKTLKRIRGRSAHDREGV